MKILAPNQNGQQAINLPDAHLITDLNTKNIKTAVQETSVCIRLLAQNAMVYEPAMLQDYCYMYLCNADAVTKQLERLKPDAMVLYSDLNQAVLMIAGLRQQSSIQGQYTPIFNTTLLTYAASISHRLYVLINETFKATINLGQKELS